MSAEVVPFGKYKGQPVEVLAADTDYCEWLTAQPWFQQRYATVYNTIINYGAEPQDSPEHNEMQARFLDKDWCRALARELAEEGIPDDANVQDLRFELSGWDVVFSCSINTRMSDVAGGPWVPVVMSEIFRVECKPDLGDDYPSVLRQVIRQRERATYSATCCVLVRRHAFQAVTWEQVKQIFSASRIRLISEADIRV